MDLLSEIEYRNIVKDFFDNNGICNREVQNNVFIPVKSAIDSGGKKAS